MSTPTTALAKSPSTSAPSEAETRWRACVSDWHSSGFSAKRFALSRGINEGTLRWWAKRIEQRDAPRFVEVVARSTTKPTMTPHSRELVVEIGTARIVVSAGFDRALLADLVRVLREVGQ
jgi:hypothetical protein